MNSAVEILTNSNQHFVVYTCKTIHYVLHKRLNCFGRFYTKLQFVITKFSIRKMKMNIKTCSPVVNEWTLSFKNFSDFWLWNIHLESSGYKTGIMYLLATTRIRAWNLKIEWIWYLEQVTSLLNWMNQVISRAQTI